MKSSKSPQRLIIVAGPTAVGKTSLAIWLAQQLHTEIISADSRQLFREMTIGTAKPTVEEQEAVKHHFIDSHSVKEEYNAARFGDEALELLHKLFRQYDDVVLCGGSGLYIKALCEGFDEIPAIEETIRQELNAGYEREGISWLQQKMLDLDPDHYQKIDQQNPHRLIRALEVKIGTGRSIRDFQGKNMRQHDFEIVKIGLEMDREVLYKRIDRRMDEMIHMGLFEEAKGLYPYRHCRALQTVGYQEIFDFMDGKYDREEAIRLLKRNSRRYAKRQLTWFKADKDLTWFTPDQQQEIMNYLAK